MSWNQLHSEIRLLAIALPGDLGGAPDPQLKVQFKTREVAEMLLEGDLECPLRTISHTARLDSSRLLLQKPHRSYRHSSIRTWKPPSMPILTHKWLLPESSRELRRRSHCGLRDRLPTASQLPPWFAERTGHLGELQLRDFAGYQCEPGFSHRQPGPPAPGSQHLEHKSYV